MVRILLVEDDPNVRAVFQHVLLDAGYAVDTRKTVEGGSAALCRRDYDLVVADGRLPDGTGLELAEKARNRGIAALVVTGYAFSLREEIGPGIDNYTVLLKPVRPSELLQAVAEIFPGEARMPH
jgi:two-component system, NtrC family, response regulator HydG